jgi:hypothetical protein
MQLKSKAIACKEMPVILVYREVDKIRISGKMEF